MKMYEERNYGADADGNRGIFMRFYDLEPEDEPEVKRQVLEQLEGIEESEYPKSVIVTLICPITEDEIDFDIEVKDIL